MEYEYKLIEKIKSRPVLFLGEPSITNLQSFLIGYATALYDYEIPNKIVTLLPLPFWFFHEYVARCYNFIESTSGWKNMILKQVNGEEEGLKLFFELFDEFKQLKVETLQSSVILNYFQMCFGESIHWQIQKFDNISFQSKCIV